MARRWTHPDIWQDIFAKYLALADPATALAAWNRSGARWKWVTAAATRCISCSASMPWARLTSASADTPLYQVFKQADGQRTYLAYNAGKAPIEVRFTDGKRLSVAPGALARLSSAP